MKVLLRTIPFFILFMSYAGIIYFRNDANAHSVEDSKPPFHYVETHWVDSVLNLMTLEEKIGQFFMISTMSKGGGKGEKPYIKNLIEKYHIGGIIFMQGSPVAQVKLTNYYQSVSKTPLFIAIDGEWGLGMRLDSVVNYPRQMLMGAVTDEELVYKMGYDVGRQCKRMGVHINFAPVIDVNNNPDNPVINSRSFGENPANVSRKGLAYMLGMQDYGIIATAKHFPGHGDTDTDSHKGLPVIKHSEERLKRIELFPFKQLIDNGLAAIMVGHLQVPALDETKNSVSSLSPEIVTSLLRNQMGFEGLTITDAMGMQGVARLYEPGFSDLKAFMAGNDIMLMSKDIPKAVSLIKEAVKNKKISIDEINRRCKKILKAKYWVGLSKFKPIDTKTLYEDLHRPETEMINRVLIENSLTLLENKEDVIPLKEIDKKKIAAVQIGNGKAEATFLKYLKLYDDIPTFAVKRDAPTSEFEALKRKLSHYEYVIVGVTNTHYYPRTYGTRKTSIAFVNSLAKTKKVIFNLFANAYALEKFELENLHSILVGFNDKDLTQELAAQLIYGGIPAKGRLPVSVGEMYPAGYGIVKDEKIRLKYSIPLELNIDYEKLKKIDTLAENAIKERAFPGCEVLFAKDGVVFFQKAYGYHTYDRKRKVELDDIYDLASITKITGTLPAIIKLTEQGKISVNSTIGTYLDELKETNKKNLRIKEILAHTARLKQWLPFYTRTLIQDSLGNYKPNPEYYSSVKTEKHPYKVAENLYITADYKDTMYERIYNTNLYSRKRYKYSDLGFYLLQKLIEEETHETLDKYVNENFYKKLGTKTLIYNPLEKFPVDKIPPTEYDSKYRKQLVKGYVHDYGAAMMGGVAGHAGLFSNANDLAKIMQMYMQYGKYGGEQILDSATVKQFNTMYYKYQHNRRGLGFDKPRLNRYLKSANSWLSLESFGHTGFTGTMVWADPTTNIVYVFLSNRIYPTAENRKIIQLGVRRNIQKVVYDAIQI